MARLRRGAQFMLLVSYEMRFFFTELVDNRGIKQDSIHGFIVIQKGKEYKSFSIICKFDYTLAIESPVPTKHHKFRTS